MKAIIMAAGRGTRISKSINKPKSLLDIGCTSILRHTVEMLLSHNIEVAVVVGFQKDKFYAELEGLPVRFFSNPFYQVTNSIASLWFAQGFVCNDHDIILANADVFWEEDILAELMRIGSETFMLVDSSKATTGDYLFKIENNRIVDHGKDLAEEDRSCEYVGIAKIAASDQNVFISRLNELVNDDFHSLWWENVLYEYREIDPVSVYDIKGKFWSEVDYIEDYQSILKHLEQNQFS